MSLSLQTNLHDMRSRVLVSEERSDAVDQQWQQKFSSYVLPTDKAIESVTSPVGRKRKPPAVPIPRNNAAISSNSPVSVPTRGSPPVPYLPPVAQDPYRGVVTKPIDLGSSSFRPYSLSGTGAVSPTSEAVKSRADRAAVASAFAVADAEDMLLQSYSRYKALSSVVSGNPTLPAPSSCAGAEEVRKDPSNTPSNRSITPSMRNRYNPQKRNDSVTTSIPANTPMNKPRSDGASGRQPLVLASSLPAPRVPLGAGTGNGACAAVNKFKSSLPTSSDSLVRRMSSSSKPVTQR